VKRVNFFAGQVLTVADLQAEQSYLRERAQRHNRLLHGWGVVSGLRVSTGKGSVRVETGMALDGFGREIHVDQPASLPLPDRGRILFLCVRYTEQPVDPVLILGMVAETSGTAFTRIEEGYELFLESSDPCAVRGRIKRAVAGPPPEAITLARLQRVRGGWTIDRRFRRKRVH
jgi:hypothetical protein